MLTQQLTHVYMGKKKNTFCLLHISQRIPCYETVTFRILNIGHEVKDYEPLYT